MKYLITAKVTLELDGDDAPNREQVTAALADALSEAERARQFVYDTVNKVAGDAPPSVRIQEFEG